MTEFQIARSVGQSALRFVDTVVDTKVADDVVSAVLHTEKGVANPLGKVPLLGCFPIGQGSFFHRANDLVRRPTNGSGVASFEDAVKALHNLGSRHGIEGIQLSENPGQLGLVRLKGDIGYGWSTKLEETIGADARARIDRAARLVQEFVDARA